VHLNIGEKFVKLFFKTLMSVSLLSLACSASAVTLGAIKVKSTQGQPLRAEIEILSLTQEEARDFHVKLATQNEHLRLGFDWRALMATITIEIDSGISAGRRPFLRVESATPVDVEKLGLALIVESSVGKARKEFIAAVPAAIGSFGGQDNMRMLAIR
jgi:pilus assembly protein FimV